MTTYGFDESGVRRIVKAVRRVENAPQATPGDFAPMVSSGTSETWIEAKNNAGETIPAYSAVNLTAGTTINGRKVPYAVKPSTTFYPLWGMTVGQDVSSGGSIGVCCETGLVKYDTGTPATGEGWGVKPGQYTLSKGYPGARVIELLDSTNKIMRVEFLPITSLLAKSTGSIASGTSATTSYAIYAGVGGSEASTWTSVPDAFYRVGSTISSGKWIQLELLNGIWYIVPWEC